MESLEDFPNEILFHLSSFLLGQDLGRLGGTSRKFHEISLINQLWLYSYSKEWNLNPVELKLLEFENWKQLFVERYQRECLLAKHEHSDDTMLRNLSALLSIRDGNSRQYLNDERLVESLDEYIKNQSDIKSEINRFISLGGADLMFQLLPTSNPGLQKKILLFLFRILCECFEELEQNSLLPFGTLSHLIHLLVYSNDQDIKTVSVCVLQLFCRISDNQIKIRKLQGIPALISILNHSSDDILESVVTCICSCSMNRENARLLRDLGGLNYIVRLISSSNSNIQTNSVLTLYNCSLVEENLARIGELGAVPVLLNLLQHSKEMIRQYACKTLCHLSLLENNQPLFLQCGGIETLLDLSFGNTKLKESAIKVLSFCSENEANCKIICTSLKQISDLLSKKESENIVQSSLAIICNCSINAKEYISPQFFEDISCIFQFVSFPSETVQINALRTLYHFGLNSKSALYTMCNLMPSLLKMAENSSRNITKEIVKLFPMLTFDAAGCCILRKLGLIEYLVKIFCVKQDELIFENMSTSLWNMAELDDESAELIASKESTLNALMDYFSGGDKMKSFAALRIISYASKTEKGREFLRRHMDTISDLAGPECIAINFFKCVCVSFVLHDKRCVSEGEKKALGNLYKFASITNVGTTMNFSDFMHFHQYIPFMHSCHPEIRLFCVWFFANISFTDKYARRIKEDIEYSAFKSLKSLEDNFDETFRHASILENNISMLTTQKCIVESR